MIEFKQVCKSYKNNTVPVLNNVSFKIQKGDHIAITGPSGSGKSTLLKLMTGLEPPSSGDIVVNDAPLHALDDTALSQIRAQSFGFIFQTFRLFPSLNVVENVMLGLQISGASDIEKTAKLWLDHVGLSHRLTHYPYELSGGEMQRVGIARALAPNPAIIIADEPTGNLDQTNSHHIQDLLKASITQSSLVLVTHDLELANMCPIQWSLKNGQLIT